ncbi:molecular chaperone [Serratia marcescens]|nr:molecular chaperone [Serratia marcescens]
MSDKQPVSSTIWQWGFTLLFVGVISLGSTAEAAGISLNRTRVVLSGSDKAESLGIRNSAAQAWLVQVRILDAQGNPDYSMVVTPPLFRLEANGQNYVRLLPVNGNRGLVSDKETLKYVEVNAVPSSSAAVGNEAQMAVGVGMRIKLFQRPASLPEPDKEMFRKIAWSRDINGLQGCNHSPYYISFRRLEINGRLMNLNQVPSMIGPGACERYPRIKNVNRIRWSAINDYGGDSGWIDEVNPPEPAP